MEPRLGRSRSETVGPMSNNKPSPSSGFDFSETHSRDDLYAARRKQSPPRASAGQRPRTAGSPTRRLNVEPWPADLKQQEDVRSFKSPLPISAQPLGVYVPSYWENAGIGMALGSPSQTSKQLGGHDLLGPVSHTAAVARDSNYTVQSGSPEPSHLEEEVRQKGKWKMFGGLFTKKAPSMPESPASPFYSLQYPAPQIVNADVGSPQLRELAVPRVVTPKHFGKPDRSFDMPREAPKRKVLSKKQTPDLKPDIKKGRSTPFFNSSMRAAVLVTDQHNQRPQFDSKALTLQLNMPDPTMERYSIMFSQVLRPDQPSLMERRQAQLEKLKPVVKDERPLPDIQSQNHLHVPVRRATSPSPRLLAPSFSLFPTPPHSAKRTPSPLSLKQASPLQRSATVPGAISPGRAFFEPNSPNIRHCDHKPSSPPNPVRSPETPTSIHDRNWSSDLSASTDPSPIDENDHDPSLAGKLLPISKYSNAAKKDRVRHIARTSSQTAAPQNLPKGSSKPSRSDPPSHQKLNPITSNPLASSPPSATEISIARQISVSRRQQLLVPIVPKTVRQPKQPTHVDVDRQTELDGVPEGGAHGHVRVKSHHVLLDYV